MIVKQRKLQLTVRVTDGGENKYEYLQNFGGETS